MLRTISSLCVCIFLSAQLHAAGLQKTEYSLKKLFLKLHTATTDSSRIQTNDSICTLLTETLQNDSSFTYAFDSLPHLGKIYSTDHQLRIYSWNYISSSGDYRFNACFQIHGKQPIVIRQNRQSYLPAENSEIHAKEWYGALYYNAIPFRYQNQLAYIILGWSRYTSQVNFKIIEIVSVSKDGIIFGAPVFRKGNKMQNRVTLSYSSRHSLLLGYDHKQRAFIFSHLSATTEKEGNVPDESFSGFFIHSENLIYKDDVTYHPDALQPIQ